jgi:type IV pilus assembly protein PilB
MGILETLVERKILGADDISAIRRELNSSKEGLEEVLQRHGVSPADILFAKGESLGIPTRSLENTEVPFDILKYVPEESAQHYRFVPIGLEDGALEIGVVDPENIEGKDAITFISSKIGMPFKLFLISEADFQRVVQTYRGLSGEVTKALTELESELSSEEIELSKLQHKTPAESKEKLDARIIEDAPVTKIVATILHYAAEGAASDIHIEHLGDKIRVRFRVDGVLNTSLVLPAKVHAAVVARIKILCNMRLDEKRKPQDGRFSARIEGRKIDFRVSTFPAYYGEKVVMRILDTEKGVKPLDSLGMTKTNLELIREAIDRPYGLILISGPTGSGKSTTLYSMLNEVDKDTENVLSLEDPVEYNIPGMNQSQVHAEIGYTFASGLRSTLRQDPDVIMVGEIRDKETAQLAIQAALTGHLVLSTIHTNSATGVIPRLIDMGVDPYLIAPTLVLAMAQRLVKKLYPNTGKPISVEGSIRMMIEKQFSELSPGARESITIGDYVYEPESTPECPTGMRGRVAVMEVLSMTPELEQVILHDPTEPAVMKIARKNGMLTMKEDALLKAFAREIPFEEVNTL